MWRGGNNNVESGITPFPHPPHRTGRAELPHPALGQDITFSPTTGHAQVASDVRDQSARKGGTEDRPRLDVVRLCTCCVTTRRRPTLYLLRNHRRNRIAAY